MKITNFGGNVQFEPRIRYAPKTEQEVLDILNKHAAGKIRVVASGHAWSDAIVCNDVVIDMGFLNKVTLQKDTNGYTAEVQAGCKLKDLVEYIHANSDVTIPTLGGLMRQTISGAISTGTHGSGASSLSHYMSEIRIAAYDQQTKQATIYTYAEGDVLHAARCAVGCMGVILSVKFRCVPKFWVQETTTHYKTLKEVLGREEEFPQQQIMLIPYLWEYSVFQRKMLNALPSDTKAWRMSFLRFYDYIAVEISSHVLLKMILSINTKVKKRSLIPWFYKNLVPKFLAKRTVVNASADGLTLHTLHHATFQHLEMEVFIPEHHLLKAVEVIQYITNIFAGVGEMQNEMLEDELGKVKVSARIKNNKSSYIHHYPFFIRKVSADDTLISTTSGNKSYYAIGFFTYLKEGERKEFYEFAYCMAFVLNKLFDARLHWGKYFPLVYEEIKHLYPNLEQFRTICKKVDPGGVFQNDYTKRVLGFS